MPGELQAGPRRPRVAVGVAVMALAVAAAVVLGTVVLRGSEGETGGEVTMSHPMPDMSRGDRGPVRHDLEPLVNRFRALGSPRSATWQGGTLGSDRIPGPSTYWIEAVVQLEPGAARRLADAHAPTPVDAPVIDEALAPALTPGPWATSAGLDDAVRAEGFSGRTFLDVEHDMLILLVVGGPN